MNRGEYEDRVEVRGEWENGRSLTQDERHRIAALRMAGCLCAWPLLGENPTGPRCRMCNTQGVFAP